MSRSSLIVTIFALLVGLGALFFLLMNEPPSAAPVMELRADSERAPTSAKDLEAEHIHGGVYSGSVTDLEGQPIHGAHVLLVSYGTGLPDMDTAGQGADDAPIARIGNMTIGGEGITDEQGAFRIAAGSASMITRVLAYHTGHFLDVTEVRRPREDILLRLPPAGRIIGTVVDNVTGDPVPAAVVDIYLQQKVSPIPENAAKGGYMKFKRKQHDMSWLVTLGRFISRDLGQRIWDVADSGAETLRMMTDKNGRFEFGPIGNSVQLEFVITHSGYMWFDFDTQGGTQNAHRTVVEPGQTVERTFRLRRGKHIAGQVLDEDGNGLTEVAVKVQSISAYYRHWWYRTRWRHTTTDSTGHFRVNGLADGSQQIIFEHPTFMSKTLSVPAGTENLAVYAERYGAIEGTIEGIAPGRGDRDVTVVLESTDENPIGARQTRRTVRLRANNTFVCQRVPPGSYRIWVKAGRYSSAPLELNVEALKTIKERFEVGGGGSITLRVIDDEGAIVDPASARLILLGDGGERPLGTFVTREGEFDVDEVNPGTYVLEVSAPSRVSARTSSFVVARDRVTRLPVIALGSWSYLRFGQPMGADGRPAKLGDEFVIELRRGKERFERVYAAGTERPVAPGRYDVRARSGELRFEAQIEVGSGKTVDVPIVLELPR